MPRAYIEMILSSKPVNRLCPLATILGSKLPCRSRGVSSSSSPKSPFSTLRPLPFRLFPLCCPAGSCFSYPRWSVSSACSARSRIAFVSCFSRPFSPMMSSGFLYPASTWSISALSIAIGADSPLPMVVYTVPFTAPAIEDKLVQQAVVTILNQIYEEDFLGFSYGFRPGRSQHQALDALSYALLKKKVNYVLDADIRGFFDNLDKSWMVKFVEHRVADPRILRLIQKWLNTGVMEEGKWSDTKTGSPQGSVVSPLLANIYLHYAFDLWVNVWREKWAHGEVG